MELSSFADTDRAPSVRSTVLVLPCFSPFDTEYTAHAVAFNGMCEVLQRVYETHCVEATETLMLNAWQQL